VLDEDEPDAGLSRLSISRSRTSSRKSHIPPPLKLWDTNKENLLVDVHATGGSRSSKLTPDTLQSALSSTGTLCESPLESFCQGWCRVSDGAMPLSGMKTTDRQLADVISLGSCKDSELSWENEEGVGMTQVRF
jgi:hypothetical protein